MSQKPLNLAIRFILEILALVAIGAWARTHFRGVLGFILMIWIPLLAAATWALFSLNPSYGWSFGAATLLHYILSWTTSSGCSSVKSSTI